MGRSQIKNDYSLLNLAKLSHTLLVFKRYFPLIHVLSALSVAFKMLIFRSLTSADSEKATLPKVQTAVSFMFTRRLKCQPGSGRGSQIEAPFVRSPGRVRGAIPPGPRSPERPWPGTPGGGLCLCATVMATKGQRGVRPPEVTGVVLREAF